MIDGNLIKLASSTSNKGVIYSEGDLGVIDFRTDTWRANIYDPSSDLHEMNIYVDFSILSRLGTQPIKLTMSDDWTVIASNDRSEFKISLLDRMEYPHDDVMDKVDINNFRIANDDVLALKKLLSRDDKYGDKVRFYSDSVGNVFMNHVDNARVTVIKVDDGYEGDQIDIAMYGDHLFDLLGIAFELDSYVDVGMHDGKLYFWNGLLLASAVGTTMNYPKFKRVYDMILDAEDRIILDDLSLFIKDVSNIANIVSGIPRIKVKVDESDLVMQRVSDMGIFEYGVDVMSSSSLEFDVNASVLYDILRLYYEIVEEDREPEIIYHNNMIIIPIDENSFTLTMELKG